jgi:polysaccharide biosynthesis protein PslG
MTLPSLPSSATVARRGVVRRSSVLAAAVLAALLAGLAPANADRASTTSAGAAGAARFAGLSVFGISDDSPATFADPRFAWLGIGYARFTVPWDAVKHRGIMQRASAWLAAARAGGVRPLVAFDRGLSHPHQLPSVHAYARDVGDFLHRFPWVTDYQTWNEENQGNQPTNNQPERAALLFNWLQAACPHCTVMAADILDGPSMLGWVEAFLRVARHPWLWGLHTYFELTYGGHQQLSSLLSVVPGRIWFTEAGYPVWRYISKHKGFIVSSEAAETAAVQRLLPLARVSPRVGRIYFYQWRTSTRLAQSQAQLRHGHIVNVTWDSGLVRPDCSARPALLVVARALGRDARQLPSARTADSGYVCVSRAGHTGG